MHYIQYIKNSPWQFPVSIHLSHRKCTGSVRGNHTFVSELKSYRNTPHIKEKKWMYSSLEKKRLCELLIDVFDFGFFNLREGDCQLGFRHLADYELNRHCYIRLKIYLEHSKSLYINKESWSSSIYIHVITFNIKTWNTHFPIPDEDA